MYLQTTSSGLIRWHSLPFCLCVASARSLGTTGGSFPANKPAYRPVQAYCAAGCFAERILLGDGGTAGRRTAQGVLARPNNSETRIRVVAPIVVASGGSLHTPALFLRSGVSCRGNVGRHLHLHVGAAVAAEFPKKVPPMQPDLNPKPQRVAAEFPEKVPLMESTIKPKP